MKDVNQIWKELQKYAEPLLPPQTVDIWLKACVPTHMDGDKLVVEALPFVVKKIREEHLATLEKVMVEHGLGSGLILATETKTEEQEKPAAEKAHAKPLIAYNGLNRQYDFASFVVGNSNRIA